MGDRGGDHQNWICNGPGVVTARHCSYSRDKSGGYQNTVGTERGDSG